ncbi:unnamed protein product [Boreogadus saida]
MEGQVAAPHPKGLEVEANLEGLEAVGLEGLEAAVGSNLEGLEAVVETGLEAERIVLPEASTERVWSWELQVDGGQEPFSPTGTDGRGDGGGRLEVRGGRLEVLAREIHGGRLEALAAGGGKAGSRAAQGMQNEGLRRRSWRQRPAWRRRWPGGPGGVQPGRGGMEGQVAAPHPKGLEVEANLEGLEAVGLEGLEAVGLEGLEAVGLEGLEAAVGSNLEGLEVVVETGLEASSGGARREVHGGRLEALAAGGGKARSRAAQGMQNDAFSATRTSSRIRSEAEVLEAEASLEAAVAWRSWRRPTWKGRHGGPGGGSSSSKVKLFFSASMMKGEKCSSVQLELCLTFQKGLEVEANLEGLEAVVGTTLEVPAVASTWRRSAWRARRRRRPGGPGGVK